MFNSVVLAHISDNIICDSSDMRCKHTFNSITLSYTSTSTTDSHPSNIHYTGTTVAGIFGKRGFSSLNNASFVALYYTLQR